MVRARPSPKVTDSPKAHGDPLGAEEIGITKGILGIPDEPFWSPPELVAAYRNHVGTVGAAARNSWAQRSAEIVATPECSGHRPAARS